MLLVSSCLLGNNCRYNGQSKPCPAVIAFLQQLELGRDYLLICPESSGGLSIPRPAGEILRGDAAAVWQGVGQVGSACGRDYTSAFLAGAKQVQELARRHKARAALLKENSPSCGVHQVYDGSFSKTLLAGQGVAAYGLAQLGVRLFNENELAELRQFMGM